MKAHWYVGLMTGARVVFKQETQPVREQCMYDACIGPFSTKRGALFMANFGQGNPHCRDVREAEKLGLMAQRGEI